MEVYLCFVATNGSIVLKVACFQARPIHGIPSDSESHKHLLLRQPRKIDMKIMIYHHNSRILSSDSKFRTTATFNLLYSNIMV